jgi:hypothetical protein
MTFSRLRKPSRFINYCFCPAPAGGMTRRAAGRCEGNPGFGMNSLTERSCWGVARWAVVAFLAGVALVYLFGGFEAATMVAG